MESIQPLAPQPNAQEELTLLLLLSSIHSTTFTHKTLPQGLPVLRWEEEERAGPRQWGPEEEVRPLLRRGGAPRLLE